MESLKIASPFNAPVYYMEAVTSTMDISRELASRGEPHGTVIIADFQEAGRGRVQGRSWVRDMEKGLAFTVLLRYSCLQDIPSALTLRIGLAVSLAIEAFEPSLQGKVMVKWPNDIMIAEKKAVGILCEAEGARVHVGVGINVAQTEFPESLQNRATSITLAAGKDIAAAERFSLLEKVLEQIFNELTYGGNSWKSRIEQKLYKRNQQVTFIEGAAISTPGAAASTKKINGTLVGLGESGELLITPNGESTPRPFITGEFVWQ